MNICSVLLQEYEARVHALMKLAGELESGNYHSKEQIMKRFAREEIQCDWNYTHLIIIMFITYGFFNIQSRDKDRLAHHKIAIPYKLNNV